MTPIPRPHRLVDAEIEQTTRRAQQDLQRLQARLKITQPKK